MLWVEDSREALKHQDRTITHPFAPSSGSRTYDFSIVVRLATQLEADFGRFSDLECKEMKNSLMDLEDVERDDGRVRLSNFYAPYLANVSFHFSESPEYLRHLGALDDRNPKQLSAIVPNLLYAHSNCLAESGFHLVCCIDDCEILFSDLEQKVAGPAGVPATVAAAVASISSDTVAAPRNLSEPLLQRLDAIAARHGGRVPLHGRLFAEWMQYAFPNECPYPRSLTAEPQMTDMEWSAKTMKGARATQEEMTAVMSSAGGGEPATESTEDGPVLVWSEDEELLGELLTPFALAGVPVATLLRFVAGMGVLFAGVSGIVRTARTGKSGGKGDPASTVHSL